jgi:hypothetical protein
MDLSKQGQFKIVLSGHLNIYINAISPKKLSYSNWILKKALNTVEHNTILRMLQVLSVTSHITKILIKWLKMQLSLKAREDQAVEVSNQNLIYQEFKFEVPKCYLVWTDILS